MDLLRKNREVAIGIASTLAFALGIGGLTLQLRSDGTVKKAPVVAETTGPAATAHKLPAWAVNRNSSDYAVVGNRRLFGSDEKQAFATNSAALPMMELPPAPIADLTIRQARLDVPPTPQSQGITIVGRVTMDGIEQAVVEDLRRGETRFVPVRGEAFGYHVEELTNDGATLERDGRRFTVAYGESKPGPRASRTSGSNNMNNMIVAAPNFPLVAGATDASSPRNWDWNNMTDEQRQAGEKYVRGRAVAMNGLQRDKLVDEWEALGSR